MWQVAWYSTCTHIRIFSSNISPLTEDQQTMHICMHMQCILCIYTRYFLNDWTWLIGKSLHRNALRWKLITDDISWVFPAPANHSECLSQTSNFMRATQTHAVRQWRIVKYITEISLFRRGSIRKNHANYPQMLIYRFVCFLIIFRSKVWMNRNVGRARSIYSTMLYLVTEYTH